MLSAKGLLSKRVLVVQPYVPAYRTAFFEQLEALLASAGVALEVAHGSPVKDQEARGMLPPVAVRHRFPPRDGPRRVGGT